MKTLVSYLEEFGLTTNESKVYATLLSNKVEKASGIAKISGIPRNKIYEIGESLSKKGFVEIIPEKVKKFRALPLNEAIKIQIEATQEKMKAMEHTKVKMNRYIEGLMKDTKYTKGSEGHFAVYKSKNIILKKIREMLANSEKESKLMINSSDLRRFIYDIKKSSAKIKVNVISPITESNKFLAKKWLKFSDLKHYKIESQIKIMVSDKAGILLFRLDSPTALFSKDEQFISLFRTFFGSMWHSAVSGKERIHQIETGKKPEEIRYVKGRENFLLNLKEIIDGAKSEILVATSSNGIIRIHKYLKNELQNAYNRGIRIRIMIPISKKNLNFVKKIDFAEIRHIESVPSVVSCHDDDHLVMIEIKDDTTSFKSPDDLAMITNHRSSVKMMKTLLENMWNSAVVSESKINEIETGEPVEETKYVEGRENVFKMIPELTKNTREIITATSANGALRLHQYFEKNPHMLKNIHLRLLCPVTEENAHIVRHMAYAEIRHIDNIPSTMACIDERIFLTMQVNDDSPKIESPRDTAMITTQKSTVVMMKNIMENLWESALPLEMKLHHIATGEPMEKTVVVRDEESIYKEISRSMEKTRKDLVVCASDYGIRMAVEKRVKMLENLKKDGVRIRYIASFSMDNEKMLEKISHITEIRYSDIPPRIILTDAECLITTLKNGVPIELVKSNVHTLVERMKELIESIWNSSLTLDKAVEQAKERIASRQQRHLDDIVINMGNIEEES
jgi:HTH-type transcriptional regulator, sugar sensing transcriptional regulator